MAEMPVPWASAVPLAQAVAVARVPMVRVLTVAVAVRPVRALPPRPRAWPAVTVVPVVVVGLIFIIQDGLKIGGLARGDLG